MLGFGWLVSTLVLASRGETRESGRLVGNRARFRHFAPTRCSALSAQGVSGRLGAQGVSGRLSTDPNATAERV